MTIYGDGIRITRLEGSLISIEVNDRGLVIKTEVRKNTCAAVHAGVTEATCCQFQACTDILWCDRESPNGVNILVCGCMQAKIGGLILGLEKYVEYRALGPP